MKYLLALAALASICVLAPAAARADTYGNLFDPHAIAISPDGTRIYAGQGLGAPYAAIGRDPATGLMTYLDKPLFPGDGSGAAGKWQRSLVVSPDSKAVYDAVQGQNKVRQMNVTPKSLAFGADYTNYLNGISGLSGPQNLSFSPDGQCLYVSTSAISSGGVVAFSRNPSTSTLSFDSYFNGTPGFGYYGIVVSPDGTQLYMATQGLRVLDRNASSCGISNERQFAQSSGTFTSTLAVSPDSKNIYVTDSNLKELRVFSRDVGTGAITEVQDLTSPATSGLDGASDVVVSPDGKNVYVVSSNENALTTFSRDSSTGVVSYQGLLRDGVGGVDGLQKVTSLVISADGKNVYTVSPSSQSALDAFSRDPFTGSLSYLQKISENNASTPPPPPVTCGTQSSDIGVTVNAAAQFTNNPQVSLTISAPAQTTGIRISNDGGFGSALTRSVRNAGTYPWTLDSSGPERLPKTVYVRFNSTCVSTSQNYTDDIILDETAPVVSSATATPVATSRGLLALSGKAPTRLYRVRLRARDNLSGVGKIQVSSSKRRPGGWRAYKPMLTYRAGKQGVWIRARDRAGNISRWQKARLIPRHKRRA